MASHNFAPPAVLPEPAVGKSNDDATFDAYGDYFTRGNPVGESSSPFQPPSSPPNTVTPEAACHGTC